MSTGLSTDRLQRIDRHLTENYIDAGRISGALTLVARRGEIAHFSALGMMDAEREKPTQEDTIYRIYSMTKPITTVALMMLYEEGRFQLNDPVADYLPEWADTGVWVSGEYPNFETRPVDRPMTIRDLLSHQSGLTYEFMEDAPVERGLGRLLNPSDQSIPGGMLTPQVIDGTLADWSPRLAELPLRFSPGDNWHYSVATDLCGRLVEVLSGDRFDLFLRGRVLDPLGMPDTGFYVREANFDRLAACYVPGEQGGMVLQDNPETSNFRKPPSFLSGGGGMVGTAPDYFRFVQMLLNGGELDGERILGRKTIELMTANHLPGGQSIAERALIEMFSGPDHDGVGFGLGFSVGLEPSRSQLPMSPGQYAWGGAASTVFWIDPAEELVFVFMTQLLQSPYPLRKELQVLVNAAIED